MSPDVSGVSLKIIQNYALLSYLDRPLGGRNVLFFGTTRIRTDKFGLRFLVIKKVWLNLYNAKAELLHKKSKKSNSPTTQHNDIDAVNVSN